MRKLAMQMFSSNLLYIKLAVYIRIERHEAKER